MKRLFPALFLLASSTLASTPAPLQTTLGASATQVTATPTACTQMDIQNNATHNVRVGDSSVSATKGILLTPGAVFTVTPPPTGAQIQTVDASTFYLFGTAGDVIDTACLKP